MPGKLWQRLPDSTGKEQLQEVSLDSIKITRPTVVYLSGFLTTNKQPGYIAGSIKQLKELLEHAPGEEKVQPDIYSWSHKGLSNLFNLVAYDSFPNRRSSEAGYILSSHLIMPLVAEGFGKNEDGTFKGKPRNKQEAQKALRNLTMFGYSAGTVVAQETFNASLKMMKGVGYTDRQARDLLKEVVLVSTGCVSRPSKEKERFSTVYLIASNDRIHRFKNWLWGTIGTALRTIFSDYAWNKHTKSLSIRSLSPSSVFMTAAAGTSFFDFVIDKNTGEKKVKKFMPLYPRWTMRRSYHELQHYVTMDPNNNGFANVVLSTLTNAIGRSETPDALKLIEPPSNGELRSETNNAYKARMKRALEP